MINDLISVVSLVTTYTNGKANEKQIGQIAVRYWGLVLNETRTNLESAREIAKDEFNFGYLNFDITSSLLPDLARMSPLPRKVVQLQQIYSKLKQLDWWQRLSIERRSASNSVSVSGTRSTVYPAKSMSMLAQDMTTASELSKFNSLIMLIDDAGRLAFGDNEWQSLQPEILPTPFDLGEAT